MCIAIMIPPKKGKFLTNEMLENCFSVNSDGIGYAIPDGKGKIRIKKFMQFDEFMAEWETDKHLNKKFPIMLHFRATSVGDTDLANCHPFIISKSQVFCHNGTIHKVAKDPKKEASDTRMFNRLFLRNLPEDWEYSLPITVMMEHYIGTSKLITLNADGSYAIINEDLGKWDGGLWFSNEHYNGKWTRGNAGAAFRRSTYNSHTTHNGVVGGGGFALAAASRKEKREKAQREREEKQKRIAYDTDPRYDFLDEGDGTSEMLCEWCSRPFDENELILTDYGNSKTPFTVCHTCANKIQFPSKG